jgi:ketosteroid isomerase-like protein
MGGNWRRSCEPPSEAQEIQYQSAGKITVPLEDQVKISRIIALIVMGIVGNGILPARSISSKDGFTAQVLASEHAWAKAAADGDAARMAGLMADDYVEIVMEADPGTKNSRWVTTSKAEWVNLVRSGREKYQSVDLRNLKVYFHGDIATVTGEYSQTATKDGKDNSGSGIYVNTWVRKNGNWQVVSSVFP